MKWMLLVIIAILICFVLGFILTKLVFRKKFKRNLLRTTLFTIVFGLIFSLATTLVYFGISYKPKEDALNALKGDETVNVSEVKNGYLFDGPGKETAMVFYPGTKVKSEAYAPLMLKLSRNGIDCFLTKMPFNFALFGENRCETYFESYKYDNWILSGHSMGGLVAANYVSKHPDKVKGLALLAAYPEKVISNNVSLLSIYGTEDGCMEKDKYEKDKSNWPINSNELVIKGGNHAQFGDYGNQSGDGSSSISKEEQWDTTCKAILEWKLTIN